MRPGAHADDDMNLLDPTTAALVLVAAGVVIVVVGPRTSRLADQFADVSGLGEAIVGAVLLGGVTSLPDIIATARPAWDGFGEQAAANALGGIVAQTAFLAIADLTYRRANLEHAGASLANIVQASVLLLLLALVALAVGAPQLTVGPVHITSILLPAAYVYGQRMVHTVSDDPLWKPVTTDESRPDEPDEGAHRHSLRSIGTRLAGLAVILIAAGWMIGEAGETLVAETGLSQGAVGALFTATSTSVAELVVAIAAVRQGALVLAVATVIGGNSFDTLLMTVGDVFYRDGSFYGALTGDTVVLIGVSMVMTSVLVLGLLRRQRYGVGNIGFEGVAILGTYVVVAAVLL